MVSMSNFTLLGFSLNCLFNLLKLSLLVLSFYPCFYLKSVYPNRFLDNKICSRIAFVLLSALCFYNSFVFISKANYFNANLYKRINKLVLFGVESFVTVLYFSLTNSMIYGLVYLSMFFIFSFAVELKSTKFSDSNLLDRSLEELRVGIINKSIKIHEKENNDTITLKKGEVVHIIEENEKEILVKRYNMKVYWVKKEMVRCEDYDSSSSLNSIN